MRSWPILKWPKMASDIQVLQFVDMFMDMISVFEIHVEPHPHTFAVG